MSGDKLLRGRVAGSDLCSIAAEAPTEPEGETGNDNPGAKFQGMKQLMAGGGVALIGITLVPLLSGLFG